MKLPKLILFFSIIFIFYGETANQAQATIVSGPDIISAPVSVNNETAWCGNPGGGVTNAHQQGFDEKQSVYLQSDLNVDEGVIPAGTLIDSHMIFFNFQQW